MKRIVAPIVLGAALVAASAAHALGADSLCVQFIGAVGGENLELRSGYRIMESLPLSRCDLRPHARYRIAVGGAGLERRVGTLILGARGATGTGGLRMGSALRNIMLPGWGSVFSERAAIGWSDAACLTGAAYVFLGENQEYRHLRNRSDNIELLLTAATSLSDRERIQLALHEASRDVQVQNKHRKRIVATVAALYAWQVIDPWFSTSPPRSTFEGGGKVARLGSSEKSGAKAFVLSLMRPGRGQFYEGKTGRGIFFSTAAVVGALAALEYHNRCDEAAARYETCVERFNASDSVSERTLLANEAAGLWDDLSRERSYRNVSYGALAGLWAWNAIDALFTGGSADVRSNYSLDLGAQGLTLVVRF